MKKEKKIEGVINAIVKKIYFVIKKKLVAQHSLSLVFISFIYNYSMFINERTSII
jgi:hypothetical protein